MPDSGEIPKGDTKLKNLNLLLLFVSFMGLSNCAHSVMRGSVAMKTSENEAHVCLGKGEVSVGDRVDVYKNVCVQRSGVASNYRIAGGVAVCEKKRIGMGIVEEILNEHYSVVKFDPGVAFEEGTIVEKM